MVSLEGYLVDGFLTDGNDIQTALGLVEDLYGCFVIEGRGFDSDAPAAVMR